MCADTYMVGGMSVQFCGWPDGQPAMEQEFAAIAVLKVVLSEVVKEISSGGT